MKLAPWKVVVRSALVIGALFSSPLFAASTDHFPFPASGSLGGSPRWNVIYGKDDRQEVYELTDPQKMKLAASTVALFDKDDLVFTNGKYRVPPQSLREAGVCEDEPYSDQPSEAFCSGSLVGPNLILTAGHCITSQNECKNVKFVFNYSVKSSGNFPSLIDSQDVVGCKSIIRRVEEPNGVDYALIETTRKITHHTPLAINRADDLQAGDKIGVIGHPSGMPTKIAYGASVRSMHSSAGFFIANLDTYSGNSGSPVFNAQTGLIEGVLVRGAEDYQYDRMNACSRSVVCSDTGCDGEEVSLISHVADIIPQ